MPAKIRCSSANNGYEHYLLRSVRKNETISYVFPALCRDTKIRRATDNLQSTVSYITRATYLETDHKFRINSFYC